MENVPVSIAIFFAAITVLTVFLFYRATSRSISTLVVLGGWLCLQFILSVNGFYERTNSLPPRMAFAIAPTLLFMLLLMLTPKGRNYMDGLDLKALTLMHVIRIPVELTLFTLFIFKGIPELMTFEGYNYDIFSGLTAPIVYYFVRKGTMNPKLLLVWNFICLALLVNIVTIAILCMPYPFQRLAFDQPNIAVFSFPYIWLPSTIVPLVFFSHLVAIRRCLNPMVIGRDLQK